MATKTIPDLPAATSVVAGTLFPIVNDPAGTPVTQKATGTQLDAYIRSAGGALTATTLDGSGGALTINTAQADKDVVVSSTGMVNLLFTDAGNNRVGINTATPTVALQVVGTVTATLFSGDGSALTSLPAITGFLIVAGNPATPVDANCWYNSTANTFRGYVTALTGTWAVGATLDIVRSEGNFGGIGYGTVAAALVAGGDTAISQSTSSKYNGTSWSSGGSISAPRYGLGGFGIASSAVVAGGDFGAGGVTTADKYNGTSWSATGSLASGRYHPGAAGASSSSGIIFGAESPSYLASTEAYNGSTFSSGGALPAVRHTMASCGSATAALSAGGHPGAGIPDTDVYVYNGTAWSTSTSLPTARAGGAASGTTTSSMSYGGYLTSIANIQSTAYKFDGSAWSTATNMGTARFGLGSAGASNASAMAFGGYNGSRLSSTEIYSEAMSGVSKTFTVS